MLGGLQKQYFDSAKDFHNKKRKFQPNCNNVPTKKKKTLEESGEQIAEQRGSLPIYFGKHPLLNCYTE